MKSNRQRLAQGYTIVELMVTVVIVSLLVVSVGAFIVKLLTIQEKEREEAYFKEKLADICGAFADELSVAKSISICSNQIVVNYPQESGGVSLETGRISRVAYMIVSNKVGQTLRSNLFAYDFDGEVGLRLSRILQGDAELIPMPSIAVGCTITPLGTDVAALEMREDPRFAGGTTAETPFGYLQVAAQYEIKDDAGKFVMKTASVERVVRLWNRK